MSGQIRVANDQGTYVIELIGDIRMVLSLSFDKFIQTMFASTPLKGIILNLRSAEAVDSTTLGLMAKIALNAQKHLLPRPVVIVEEPGMIRLLESMGFDEIFAISGTLLDTFEGQRNLMHQDGSEEEFRQQVLKAHKILMSLNETNHNAFCDLVESLDKPS